MSICCISGVPAEEPVVSKNSGFVFERRLIEKHIKQTGTCPMTNEQLAIADLLPLKLNPAIKPRPATANSLPGLMKVMQDEWDALVLECYNLKQHQQTLRQELAHALYQHDAACRVIARLIKERDEARGAMSDAGGVAKRTESAPQPMEVEGSSDVGISEEVITQLQSVAKTLSKGRKKKVKSLNGRVIPRQRMKRSAVTASFSPHSPSTPGVLCLDLHPTSPDLALTGGADSNAILFNRAGGKIVATLSGHKKKITDVAFHPSQQLLFTTSSDNTAIIWGGADGKFSARHTIRAHNGEVLGCSVHPTGDFLATASTDHTWGFHDIATGVCRQKVDAKIDAAYTRVQFHPDGLILGAGTSDSNVRIFDIKFQKNVATFKGHSGRLTGLSFSENGYYLASGDEHGMVKLWDLRKLANFHTISSSDLSFISNLSFDSSGSYLGVSGDDVRVFSTKNWELVETWKDHKSEVTAVKFGADAAFFATTSKDRTLKFWGAQESSSDQQQQSGGDGGDDD
jgi:pre-mRNA-processing factor 19